MGKRIKEQIQAKIFADHPVFERLIKDKECRPYVTIHNPHHVKINDHSPSVPDYIHGWVCERINLRSIDEPAFNESMWIEDKDYAQLWADFDNAYKTLKAMTDQYSTREKFLVDFPEYKDYLPTVEKAGLPAVIPSQVRAELSALGIPAK